ncbi:MAG: DUF692 domain-containing protein [Parahaliea sp.]
MSVDGPTSAVDGVGLGLRRPLLAPLLSALPDTIDFLELAPENWIGVGGRYGRQLRQLAEHYPLILHGLSLDIGGTDPLDLTLVRTIRRFMDELGISVYSEHLSYCAAQGHLYDLLPIPFTKEAVDHVCARIGQVQDILGQPLILENASYYAQAHRELSEAEFINAVVDQSGCELLLDVNNVYVNSVNHAYSAHDFLQAMPLRRVRYIHVAGHYDEAEDLKVDTHGSAVIDPVWALLAEAYELVGPVPTLLERDFNLPPLAELLTEMAHARHLQQAQAASPCSAGVGTR